MVSLPSAKVGRLSLAHGSADSLAELEADGEVVVPAVSVESSSGEQATSATLLATASAVNAAAAVRRRRRPRDVMRVIVGTPCHARRDVSQILPRVPTCPTPDDLLVCDIAPDTPVADPASR